MGETMALLRARQNSATPTDPAAPVSRQAARVNAEQIADCFAAFNDCDDPELRKTLSAAVRFCASMASATAPARWLTLLGDPGCGKTMLAKCIVRFFRRHLDGLRDENYPGVIRYRTGGVKPWGDAVQEMIAGDYTGLRNLRDDWLVCLDDIGVEYTKHAELARSKLFETLNARNGRWTVITANLTLKAIQDGMDPRISSRLLRDGSEVIDCAARDYAKRQQKP